jgi:hypothetical protein
MQDGRRVLVLAVQPHDGRLAIALDTAPQRLHRLLAEERPQLFAELDQRGEVVRPPAGEGVLDDGHRRRFTHGTGGLPPAVGADFLDDGDELPDLHGSSGRGRTQASNFTGSGETCQISRA